MQRVTTTEGASDLDTTELDLRAILAILQRQRRLLGATLLVVQGLAVAYLVAATPIYQATVLLQVDGRSSNLLDPTGTGQEQSAILNSRVDSEVEILRSDATALAVIERAGLIEDPEFGPQMGWFEKLGVALGLEGGGLLRAIGLGKSATPDADRLVDGTLLRLQDAVDVRRRGLTYLIAISVASEDPDRAASIANAYAKTYIERQVSAKTQATIDARDVLRRQIETAQQELATSETAINSFIEENLARLESETRDPAITVLRSRLTTAKQQQDDLRARMTSAEAAIGTADWTAVQSILRDEAISELARQRDELAAQLNGLEQGSAEAVDLSGELANLDTELAAQANANIRILQEEMTAQRDREGQAQEQLRSLLLESDLSAEMLAELFNLQQSATVARNQYQTLLAREQDLGTLANLQLADARVVSEALAPISPAFPNARLILALALVGGLGLGTLLAFLKEFYIGGVTSSSQLANIMQADVPVTFGILDQVRVGEDPAGVVLTSPMSLYAETFRKLRAAIDVGLAEAAAQIDPKGKEAELGKVILICSALQAEGKSTTAIGLARTYAMAGVKTLLIDADMRKPTIGKRLNLTTNDGLISILTREKSEDGMPIETSRDPSSPLIVIPAGERSSMPTDQLLNDDAFRQLMDLARQSFDLVILDSPPLLPVVDTRYLARFAHAVVHVVRYATTTQGEVREASTAMRQHLRPSAHYIGVLNLEERADIRYGYYSNYSYYGED